MFIGHKRVWLLMWLLIWKHEPTFMWDSAPADIVDLMIRNHG